MHQSANSLWGNLGVVAGRRSLEVGQVWLRPPAPCIDRQDRRSLAGAMPVRHLAFSSFAFVSSEPPPGGRRRPPVSKPAGHGESITDFGSSLVVQLVVEERCRGRGPGGARTGVKAS